MLLLEENEQANEPPENTSEGLSELRHDVRGETTSDNDDGECNAQWSKVHTILVYSDDPFFDFSEGTRAFCGLIVQRSCWRAYLL